MTLSWLADGQGQPNCGRASGATETGEFQDRSLERLAPGFFSALRFCAKIGAKG